jgi:hypothetical protein
MLIPINSRCDDIWYAFFWRGCELMMFVRGVHYSDYLEHDLCIQDEFTIPTSPCIMSSQLVLSSTWQKKLCITWPQAIAIPQRHVFVTLSCSACIKLENVFGNLFAVLFIHVTCDAHLSYQCWNHARKYSTMHLQRIFNCKKLTVSWIFICMFTSFKLWQWYIVVKLMLHS